MLNMSWLRQWTPGYNPLLGVLAPSAICKRCVQSVGVSQTTVGGLNKEQRKGARAVLEMCFVMSICLSQEAWSTGPGRHSELWSALLLCHSISTCLRALPRLHHCSPPTALPLSWRVSRSDKNKIRWLSVHSFCLKRKKSYIIFLILLSFLPFLNNPSQQKDSCYVET